MPSVSNPHRGLSVGTATPPSPPSGPSSRRKKLPPSAFPSSSPCSGCGVTAGGGPGVAGVAWRADGGASRSAAAAVWAEAGDPPSTQRQATASRHGFVAHKEAHKKKLHLNSVKINTQTNVAVKRVSTVQNCQVGFQDKNMREGCTTQISTGLGCQSLEVVGAGGGTPLSGQATTRVRCNGRWAGGSEPPSGPGGGPLPEQWCSLGRRQNVKMQKKICLPPPPGPGRSRPPHLPPKNQIFDFNYFLCRQPCTLSSY